MPWKMFLILRFYFHLLMKVQQLNCDSAIFIFSLKQINCCSFNRQSASQSAYTWFSMKEAMALKSIGFLRKQEIYI